LIAIGAVVSTVHLAMKFPGCQGDVITIRGNKDETRECYMESLKISKALNGADLSSDNRCFQPRDPPKDSAVLMLNLDPMADFEYQRPQPEGDLITVQIGDQRSKVVMIGAALHPELRSRFIAILGKNVDLFAWSPYDMPGINPAIYCDKLALKPGTTPIAQKKRRILKIKRKQPSSPTSVFTIIM
jgi:hypothetical protein